MKKTFVKLLLIGLGWAGGLNMSAFASPAQTTATPAFLRSGAPVSDPACPDTQPARAGSETGVPVLQKPLSVFGNLPLYFTAAFSDQANHPAQFVARGDDYQFLISPTEAQLELQKTDAGTREASWRTMRMQFVGAGSEAQIHGADELPGKVNYLIGNNPARWHTGMATFARVRVERLYPGVNLVYYGNQRRLEYDFTVAPGANPDAIKIRFRGTEKVSIGLQGELILALGKDEVRQPAPVIYQLVHGRRQTVRGGYRLVDAHTVVFAVGKYDHKLPLVIDPVISFSTYFGGAGSDTAWKMAMDTNGFIYIAGQTTSGGLATSNAFQANNAGGSYTGDAFVAKLDNSGSNLIYFTYLGGGYDDLASALAVDNAGDVFLTGFTDSPNFPTANALFPTIRGHYYGQGFYNGNAFVAELGPTGSNLIYSTYLGGSGFIGNASEPGRGDEGSDIAVDSTGNAYVIGYTSSSDFPTVNPLVWQLSGATNVFNHLAGTYNAFLTKIGPGGSNLLYSTYFGGNNIDAAEGIAVDAVGTVYLTGFTDSTNFPTKNPVQPNFGGSVNPIYTYDAFVAAFAPSTTNLSLLYSTFLGGTNSDFGYGIIADTNGNAYVVGGTASPDFPDTVTNVPGLYNGQSNNLVYGYGVTTNAFLTQITWNGTNAGIGYSAVFGGTNFGIDIGYGVAMGPSGNLFVVGASSTTNFPAFNNPGLMGPTNAGGYDAFVTAFSPGVSSILYSGYLGGSGDDLGYGIAVDSSTNVYIAGQTASANFPTLFARQSSLSGYSDAFLAKIGWVNEKPQIAPQPTNQAVAAGTSVSFVSAATGTPPLTYQWRWQPADTNSIWTNLVNGGSISGATSSTLTINNAQTTNSGNYQLIVTNFAGSVTSSNAFLTVTNAFPLITVQPVSQTIEVGAASVRGYISFSVTNLPGTLPETYQWVKDGTNLVNGGTNVSSMYPFHIYGATNNTGGTNATLYIVDPQTNDEGTYWLVITNPAGVVTSSNATLTVVSFPAIVTSPTNQAIGLGSTVTFTVTALGTATLGYQWQFNGANMTDGTNVDGSIITGSTSAYLTIQNAQTNEDGGYTVVVTNSLGSVTSSPPAILTVLTMPMFTGITMNTSGSFTISGVGGTNGKNYVVLASTNLALPLNQWTVIQITGNSQFGSQGQFSFTSSPPTNAPQRFYILELPPP